MQGCDTWIDAGIIEARKQVGRNAHTCALSRKSHGIASPIVRRNTVTLIITADCVIAVIHGGRHSAGGKLRPDNAAWWKKKERERKEGEKKRCMTRLRDLFSLYLLWTRKSSLSVREITDWRSDVCRVAAASFARRAKLLAKVSWNPLYVARSRINYGRTSWISMQSTFAPAAALSVPVNPLCTRRSLPSMARPHEDSRHSWTRGQIYEQSRRLLDISPSQNDRNIQEEMYNTTIIT